MSAQEKVPTGESNPLYGCAIFVIILSIVGGIVCWVIYSGLKQNEEIGKFAVDVAEPLPVAEVSVETRSALEQKLTTFLTANAGGAASLTLDVPEMNALVVLAGEAGIADYRGMVRFTGMDATGKAFLADLVWPMNRLSLTDKSQRFLVGQASFEPYIDGQSMDLRIGTLAVPGKTVSEGFLRSLQNWPWLNLAKLNAQVAETMKRVGGFEFSADGKSFRLDTKAPGGETAAQ
ncbi:hypothetical protein FEM03_21135 [Phragmitibacter flavus]|uniref:Uncharacterized protein n=1 Tax=Phragmitibacter flavus TaxID=2576071 RepID=A0A5R8K8R6_9BACT|nr:hypothetical protein [Phragmitibacter flavus]TLD68691.1 hypothetical protein FEM03_21135 [Phragmitibacter flavus]